MYIHDAVKTSDRVRNYPYYEGPFAEAVRHAAHESAWDLALIAEVGVPPGPKLEVGAGWGRVVRFLLEADGEVWALERSSFYVSELRKLASEKGSSNEVIVVEADFSKTALPERYFSAIYVANLTVDAIQTEEELAEALAAFRRSIRPDGIVVIFAIKDESGRGVFKQYNGQVLLARFTDSTGKDRLKVCSITFDPVTNELTQEYLIPEVEACEQFLAYSSVTERIWLSSEVVECAQACGFSCRYGPQVQLPERGALDGVLVQTIICYIAESVDG